MKAINTSSTEQANLDKFKAKINGWITSIGLPYHLDDLTPDGGIYTIFCPVVWKELYSAHELKTALKQDVDAEKINIEYIDFKRLIPPKQPLYTTFPAEQTSDELEEAANAYADDNPCICLENDGGLFDDYDKPKRDFIAGANWQKEQIMKSAVDATCIVLPPPDVFKVLICQEVTNKLVVGQKMKVIVKEGEQ